MTGDLWHLDHVSLPVRTSARLKDVTLDIPAGRTAIIGASGSGKTSLLNLLVGFERPQQGRVERLDASFEKSRLPIAWVPPDDGLWPHMTVRQHLELGLTEQSNASSEIDHFLELFDLNALAERQADQLSRGERSRVALARALSWRPSVLIADEPLSHVDPARCEGYWERFDMKLREDQTSLVMATHEPERVLAHCDRAIGLDSGRVVYDGTVEDLYHDPPDRDSGWLLGPINWISHQQARKFLGSHDTRPGHGVRPAMLDVAADGESPIEVISTRSHGVITRSQMKHSGSGEVADFYHRPPREQLRPGMKIALRFLTGLLLAISCLGCDSETIRQIPISEERSFVLPPSGSLIPAPRAVAIGPNDERFVLDNAGRVLVFDSERELIRQWEMPDSEAGNPEGLCLLDDGRIIVTDTHYYRLVYFSPEGEVLKTVGSRGEEPGQFIFPVAIERDDTGHLYVGEYGGNDRIQKLTLEGDFVLEFGTPGTEAGEFQRPSGLVWRDDRLYVADAFNSRIQIFSGDGKYVGTLGDESAAELGYPYELKMGPEGDFYVVEYAAGRVSRLDPNGVRTGAFGSAGRGKGQFATPWGLAVDSKGTIVVADTGNRRIVELIR
ncbi:ATP-binding cassette domain-containing protein [Stratiformator vulcanicus]|uniref:Fe(3+) ions import ATP-binding protein FbpC n=1 Tax=Stratiformator vulcanicus TaxID=2527980 RepID=A0A517R0C0_9PLAN|nr:ATP-binding cassette domain-containing protein [Stratiformator vulcanicus]QDT37345.1 Fe(3+) ions import ATP-binding protein FbpC [Stratiformator vulcanicus]